MCKRDEPCLARDVPPAVLKSRSRLAVADFLQPYERYLARALLRPSVILL